MNLQHTSSHEHLNVSQTKIDFMTEASLSL